MTWQSHTESLAAELELEPKSSNSVFGGLSFVVFFGWFFCFSYFPHLLSLLPEKYYPKYKFSTTS